MAHNGVLFLDEILEFKREVLEVLREPLEEKVIRIKVKWLLQSPSNFLLVGAFNRVPVDFIQEILVKMDVLVQIGI